MRFLQHNWFNLISVISIFIGIGLTLGVTKEKIDGLKRDAEYRFNSLESSQRVLTDKVDQLIVDLSIIKGQNMEREKRN